MSFINFQGLPSIKAYTRPYDRDVDPFGNISVIHPLHPMRKMETIVVSSLREMEDVIQIGVDIPNLISDNGAYYYATSEANNPKPEIQIRVEEYGTIFFRLAATTNIPTETYSAEGVNQAIKGILTRRLDALEAQIWARLFVLGGFVLTTPTAPQTFRELFALAKAFLSRIAPTDSFDAILSPRAFGAAIFENMLASNIEASYTEHQVASGKLNLIPFAGTSITTLELVAVYPSYFPSFCRRYIYELYYDNVVIDNVSDRNYRRITAERYVLPLLPRDYYYNSGGYFAAPIVVLRGQYAISNIASYYSIDTLNNLDYVTTVT
jgi:hypothetical protein